MKTALMLALYVLVNSAHGESRLSPKMVNELRLQSEQFFAPNASQLLSAKSQVAEALESISSEHIKPKWILIRREVGIAELEKTLQTDEPDLLIMRDSLFRLTRDLEKPVDLGHPQWKNLRQQLRQYLRQRMALQPEARERAAAAYRVLQGLATDKWNEVPVREAFETLIDYGQHCPILTQVRDALSKPNFYLGIHQPLFNTLKQDITDQPIDINETMQGVSTVGTGVMNGVVSLRPTPNKTQAEIQIVMTGAAQASVTSTKVMPSGSVATIFSNVQSDVTAAQSILVNKDLDLKLGAQNISVTQRTAPHSSHFQPSRGILRGRLRAKVALNVAQKKTGEVDAIGAAKTKEKISEEISKESEEKFKTVSSLIEDQLRKPFNRGDLFPVLASSSSTGSVIFSGLLGQEHQLTSFVPPPQVSFLPGTAMYVYLHESSINNADEMTAGKEVPEYEFRKKVFGQFAIIPEDEMIVGRSPSSITFENVSSPYRVQFSNSEIIIDIYIKAFEIDGVKYSDRPFRLSTRYSMGLRRDPSGKILGSEATRLGTVEIYSQGELLSGLAEHPDADIRALSQIGDRLFLPRIEFDGVSMEQVNENLNFKLQGNLVYCDKGWLILGLGLVETN